MVPWPSRTIQKTPLTELWNDRGAISATPVRDVTAEDIASLLRSGSVQFMVAAIGEKPRWIPRGQTVTFWKAEVKDRLVEKVVYNDQLPRGGGYWAQEWHQAENDMVIVVLTRVS
jgi:hypothetical protein